MRAEGLHQLGRLWRTLRWLRPEQFTGRLRVKLQRPRLDARPAPRVRAAIKPWVLPARRAPSLVGPRRMTYLGVAHELDEVGWDAPSLPLLWRYNQHYFEDLCAFGARERHAWHRELLTAWLTHNPPGHGTAWAPYPISLRICNWIKGWCAVPGVPAPDLAWVHSLAVQARWLTQRLEWHLLGNHLFANAKALLFAGLYFEGPEADAWWALAERILLRELPEQILPDGGQFERSPMYHALALEDVLDMLNVVQAYGYQASGDLRAALSARVPGMLHWLRAMVRPDGTLARFNDCADGIAPTIAELERYAQELGFTASGASGPDPVSGRHAATLSQLEPSGYIRLAGAGGVAWLDVAPVGPDYLPGHAHADTLSFELAIGGRTVVVNRGTSEYGDGPRRQLERGTAAHSTLEVAGQNSSEVWAGFRVGRRARVQGLRVAQEGSFVRVSARHDGYAHLPGQPMHTRLWQWSEPGSLTVTDEIQAGPRFRRWAQAQSPSVARFHLAPGLALDRLGERTWQICEGSERVAVVQVEAGEAEAEAWQHAEGFGRLRDAVTLAVKLQPDQGRSQVRWQWVEACTSSS